MPTRCQNAAIIGIPFEGGGGGLGKRKKNDFLKFNSEQLNIALCIFIVNLEERRSPMGADSNESPLQEYIHTDILYMKYKQRRERGRGFDEGC